MPSHRWGTAIPLVFGAMLCAVSLAACTPSQTSSTYHPLDDSVPASVNCRTLAASIIERDRTGSTGAATNGEMDALSQNCPTEYAIVTDYFSMVISATRFGPKPCDSWTQRNVRPESIELLRQDGLCTVESAQSAPAKT